MITLPAILDIPSKLLPIITQLDKFIYFLLDGGRGSGKSHTFARLILWLGEKYNLRIVCGREIQASIDESVYALLCDLIKQNNLDYEILATKINHRTSGTTIRFHGFREQGNVNLKGLEGIDILWIDEGQSITKPTIDIVIPTIRKNNAKVFVSMNRYLEDDPVYVALHDDPDCLSIHIDYFENKHCTEKLRNEAEKCKAKDIEDYEHIWLGKPLKTAKTSAFKNVEGIVDGTLPMVETGAGILIDSPRPAFHYSMGADLAKSMDYTVLSVICIETKKMVYWERMENENRASWNYQKQKILAVSKKYNNALVVTDSTGVGDPITEDLQRMDCNVFVDTVGDTNPKEVAGFKFTGLSKENLIEKLKITIELQLIRIPAIKILVTELKQFLAIKLPSGKYKYGAPEGKDEGGIELYHDDAVISLALALWGTRAMIYSPDYTPPAEITRTDTFWKQIKEDINKRNNDRQGIEEYDIDEASDLIIE